jgi:hypothetical protein
VIHLWIPAVPVSSNHAYLTIKLPRGSKRVLTAEGKKFKTEATAHLTQHYAFALKSMVPNKPYAIYFRFTMAKLSNATWPESAECRYKKTDASNRLKLVEDVLADVTAVDDSHYFTVAGSKVEGTPERTDIWIWSVEDEGSPFDSIGLSLPTMQPNRASAVLRSSEDQGKAKRANPNPSVIPRRPRRAP